MKNKPTENIVLQSAGAALSLILAFVIIIACCIPLRAEDKYRWEPYPWPNAEYPSREKPMRRDLSEPLEFGAKYPKPNGDNQVVTKTSKKPAAKKPAVKKTPVKATKKATKPKASKKQLETLQPLKPDAAPTVPAAPVETVPPETTVSTTEKPADWLWLGNKWVIVTLALALAASIALAVLG